MTIKDEFVQRYSDWRESLSKEEKDREATNLGKLKAFSSSTPNRG